MPPESLEQTCRVRRLLSSRPMIDLKRYRQQCEEHDAKFWG